MLCPTYPNAWCYVATASSRYLETATLLPAERLDTRRTGSNKITRTKQLVIMASVKSYPADATAVLQWPGRIQQPANRRCCPLPSHCDTRRGKNSAILCPFWPRAAWAARRSKFSSGCSWLCFERRPTGRQTVAPDRRRATRRVYILTSGLVILVGATSASCDLR